MWEDRVATFRDHNFVCVRADTKLDDNYHSCMANHPGKITYEKWFQVIFSMDLVKHNTKSKWWRKKYTERQKNKWWKMSRRDDFYSSDKESEILGDKWNDEDHKWDLHKIAECQREKPTTPSGSPRDHHEKECERLLNSYYAKANTWTNGLSSLKKVWYRGIVAMHMKSRKIGNTKTQVWHYDKDQLRQTLMWSQTSRYGPWLQIPHGCPTLITKRHKKKIVTQCVWYNKIGKQIKSVANYASFLPNEDGDIKEMGSGTGIDKNLNGTTGTNTKNLQDVFSQSEDYQPPSSVTPKAGIARCLLKKISTISETKTVQCFFKGLTDGGGPSNGWVEGLPKLNGGAEPVSAKDIMDCKYKLSAHQHGKVCFDTIQLAAAKSKVWTACEDFVDWHPSAKFYGKCIDKCSNAFKKNFGNYAYNHRLHRGWGNIEQSWIDQYEPDDHSASAPNHRDNNVGSNIKVNVDVGKYETASNGMSNASPWR